MPGLLLAVLLLIGRGIAPSVQAADFSKDDLKTIAVAVAHQHKLDVDRFLKTIECESAWNTKAVSKTGDYGLVQMNAKAHPDISRERMYDPLFSLEWMAEQWNANHQRWWVCYQLTS